MKCERCQNNHASVRIDEQLVNGKRVQHYLCRECVDELMSAAMNQFGGSDGQGNPGGAPFGFFSNNANASSAAGGVNTATAQRHAKNTKKPTLNHHTRYLTSE